MPTVTSKNKAEFEKEFLKKKGLLKDDDKDHKSKKVHYHGTNQEKLAPQEHRLFWVTPDKTDAAKYADMSVSKYGGKPVIHEVDIGDQEHKFLNPIHFFRMQAKMGDKEAYEEAKKQGYTALKHPEGNAIALLHPNQVKFDKK